MAKVTIYSTTTCGFCVSLKKYLQSKNIAYDEKLADKDQQLARELYEKSGQLGVPFTIIENDGKEVNIVGFDRQAIDAALGIQ